MLREETVTLEMLNLLRELQSENLFKGFVLAGGTALSLQIGHRKSIDIDLFSTDKHDYSKIREYFISKYNEINIFFYEDFSLQLLVKNIKVDLVSIRGSVLEIPKTIDGITLYGLNDISAMKLSAIEGRKRPKDYIDIAYLLKEISLEKMLDNYKAKYDKSDIMSVKKALTEANKVNPFEWEKVDMIKNDIFISDIPKILNEELLAYNKKHKIGKPKSFFKRFFK